MFGEVLSIFFHILRKPFNNPKSIYVLMRHPLGFGDLMMLSPFMLDLVGRFPDASIFLVTEYSCFINMKGVTWIHPEEVGAKEKACGLVISPTLSFRHIKYIIGAKWFLGYFFSNRMISNFTANNELYNPRQSHYYKRASIILNALDAWKPAIKHIPDYPMLSVASYDEMELPEDYICIVPVNNWEERQYPLERYHEIVNYLSCYYTVVLLGGKLPAELEIAEFFHEINVINLVGKTNFQQACSVIVGARLFIGNDSGLTHAAFLGGVPSIAIFGCVSGKQRIPLNPSLSSKITCLGAGERCPYFPCYDGFNKPNCKHERRKICLEGVDVETVIGHAMKILNLPELNSRQFVE
jgi:ADP-heptose:LPS heptosyltransferase